MLINIKLKNKGLAVKIIIFLVSVIVVLFGYYFFMVIPKQVKYEQSVNYLNGEVVKLKSEMDSKKVYVDCDKEAESKARELLAKKIELGKVSGGYDVQEYQKAYDLGLRLKDDYNSFYENCLRRHGVKY